MYLVGTRIRRLRWARKPVVTSSRSAMVRTSIQACGTATTTLALPKPSGSISKTRRAGSRMLLRARISPVKARCTAPRDRQHAAGGSRNACTHQIFAGDAEMHRAARKLCGDFAGRQIGDLDIVE